MSFTSKSTGGSYKHKLSTSELASHNHNVFKWFGTVNNSVGMTGLTDTLAYVMGRDKATTGNTANTGGNSLHNNIQPYYVVYIWTRTA